MPCGYTRGRVVLKRRPVGQFRHYKLRRYLSCLVLASECWPQRFSAAVKSRNEVSPQGNADVPSRTTAGGLRFVF